MKKSKRIGSLRMKMLLILFMTSIVLCSVTVVGINFFYEKALTYRYEILCKTVSETVTGSISADNINLWLDGQNTREYIVANNMLKQLKKDVPDLDSIAVYQMRSNGMYTIFNTDSQSIGGGVGELVEYDSRWGQYKDKFLSSKEVGKILVNSTSGKVMMYCIPILDAKSNCVAYACSGVSMNLIKQEQNAFIKKYSIILFLLSILIAFIVAFYVEKKITVPIKRICDIASKATNISDSEFIREITLLKIKTGDEIENIWRSVIKIFTDKVQLMSAIQKTQDNTALTFVTLIKRIDGYTATHIDTALQYVIILTDALRKKERYKDIITDSVYNSIICAAPLHDIGKLSVPDYILNKPDKLTEQEFEIMKEHTVYGAKLIEETAQNVQDAEYLELARQLSESHHERWDGKGYPYGLKGEEIPLPVRIVAVVDVFDALVSKRCYKNAIPFDEAYNIIIKESGTHFDPDIVDVFAEIRDQIFETYSKILNRQ